jgi:endonuclease-8
VPEGDTIYRAAAALHRALAGRVITGFESVLPHLTRLHDDTPIVGRTVEQVRSAGKHVLMHFSGGAILRTHMRMNGTWHIYRPGERWQRPRRDMRIVVATAPYHAVGFNIPVAQFHTSASLERQVDVRNMGPDLLRDFDRDEALRRLRARPDAHIAEALVNQRVIAGAGNVFKSETLFLAGVHPFTPVSRLPDEALERIVDIARKLLEANVAPESGAGIVTYRGLRRTTGRSNPADRLWVYGRAGKPCRKCGTPIEYRKSGVDARGTYWCANCQSEWRTGIEELEMIRD